MAYGEQNDLDGKPWSGGADLAGSRAIDCLSSVRSVRTSCSPQEWENSSGTHDDQHTGDDLPDHCGRVVFPFRDVDH